MEICFSRETVLAVDEWIHDQSDGIRITRIALEILGAGFAIAAIIAFEAISIPLLVGGAFIIALTEIVYQILSLCGFLAAIPSDHPFTEATFRSSRVYYQGDFPILEIGAEDPFEAGYDHGYLMAPHIFHMLWRTRLTTRVFSLFHYHEIKEQLPEILNGIPPHYLDELRGLVAGMNAWDKKHSLFWECPITLEEAVLFQLIPDFAHATASNLPPIGCSVLIEGDPPTVVRHLDWPSLGVYGSQSIGVHKPAQNTFSIKVPGLIGDLTAVNTETLVFACLNVASGKLRIDTFAAGKIPATFLVRQIVETCQSVENVPVDLSPLTPFHLTVADSKSAAFFHLRQGKHEETIVRKVGSERSCTFNDYYETEKTITHRLFFSKEREATAKTGTLSEAARKAPINNHLTIHHIVYKPSEKNLSVSVDDSFAASRKPTKLNVFR